jgi:phosphopantothenoylcysteine decarboxylase/phosphopantothenate--cysteine ligase
MDTDTEPAGPLAGLRVVVTAGGTREPLDPVRYLGNRSSGKQGMALADVAAQDGADVTLIACNMVVDENVDQQGRLHTVGVGTALELQAAVAEAVVGADVVVMCAAVADFRPAHYEATKIKKTHDGERDDSAPTIELVRNPDILAGLVAQRNASGVARPLIVGFAAETGDDEGSVLDHARAKLARKGCDLLVANEVGDGITFGLDTSTAYLLRPGSDAVTTVGPADKRTVAAAVWRVVGELLAAR